MVEKTVMDLVNQMKEEQIIDLSEGDNYEYALLTIIESFLTTTTILVWGLIYKQFVPTICFLVFFFSLRRRTGGYHAKKFWQCYLATVLTYFMVLRVAAPLSRNPITMYILLGCSIILIELIGTVNHPNVDMDIYELRESQRAARIMVLLEGGIILILIIMGFDMLYVSYMSIAIILCAMLMVFAKIIKQEVKVK
jgi:accessory gene regulator B